MYGVNLCLKHSESHTLYVFVWLCVAFSEVFCTKLYIIKLSNPIQMICLVAWLLVSLYNTNNQYTIISFQIAVYAQL